MVEPHSYNFRVITTNILGGRIFRKFTVPDSVARLFTDDIVYQQIQAPEDSHQLQHDLESLADWETTWGIIPPRQL